MGVIIRTVGILTALFLLFSFSNCDKPAAETEHVETAVFTSFRDIPGVTAEEIAAISALKERYTHFVYGVDHTIEAFPVHLGQDNEIGGYSARFCEWLTDLFGIPFIPSLYMDDWHNLMADFESGDVHFMGDLMPTEGRRETHFMTGTISERSLTVFQTANARSITEIARSRPPRLAFPKDYALHAHTIETAEFVFESVFVDDYAHAYRVIAGGEADGFVTMHTAEPTLARYGDVVGETFFPLVFASASLSTRKSELEPVIAVVQKALDNGARAYLSELHNQGSHDYLKNELFRRLSDKELDYIKSKPVVKVLAETENYPISFYNENENEFEGIAFDVLSEVELITGLSFEIADTRHRSFIFGADMLEHGEVSMITELGTFKENIGRFLWPQTPIMRDHSVLISKSELSDVHFHELDNVSVGIVRSTGHAALFKGWFPNKTGYKEYDNSDSAFTALERGEIDVLLSRANYLLSLKNYKEIAGYKANTIFGNYFYCFFGFNKDEELLCGIVDKALALIDLEAISGSWTHKTFDYRSKVTEARLPWLIGAIALSLVILGLILVMFYRNHNEGKRLAKIVAEETATLMAIFDASPEHIFCKDLNSCYTRMNKSMENYYNIRKVDIVGKNDIEALGVPEDLAAQYVALDNQVFKEKKAVISEEFVASRDGGMLFFETIKAPLIQDGEVTGLVAMSRDMTQHKATEEEARKASAEAKIASEAKSQFLANMSHEIRTPMNAILGITEIMLRRETVARDVKEELYKIAHSGDLLLNIINDILDLSKIETGRLELSPTQYDTASLINDTSTLNLLRIGGKPVEFQLAVAHDVPATLVGDYLRIKQVLNNLLSNAFKYTQEGEVKLSVSVENGTDEGAITLVCGVSDTGIGMSKEQVDKLFSEYTRFNRGANRTSEGTGLGLNITYNLLNLMNGGLSVESEPGKGSVFTVRLPQRKIGSVVLGKELAEKLEKFEVSVSDLAGETQVVPESMAYGSVLVVDDVESNLYVAKGLLGAYDLSIDTAVSGFEAIDKIKDGGVYNVIFMDHMMPKMDGVETVKKIREMGYKAPIVALTANAVVGQSDIFMENGFDGFIPKPIDTHQMDAVLKKFIRDNRPRKPPDAAPSLELAEIFIRDAAKAIETLETTYNAYGDDEIRLYTINVHAMKSALLNVGEKELSAAAFRLEQAGREKDSAVMSAETPGFLDKLRAIIVKLTPSREDEGKAAQGEQGYLREKLLVIIKACEECKRKTAKNTIVELRQREWPRPTREMLGTMAEKLLNGDFEEVAIIAKKIINPED